MKTVGVPREPVGSIWAAWASICGLYLRVVIASWTEAPLRPMVVTWAAMVSGLKVC